MLKTEYLKVVYTSLSSLLVLFLLAKMMGNKQISQLTMFDYIVGITIGSIAAEMATELEKPLNSVVAMLVYAIFSVLISALTMRNMFLRRLIFGQSIILMRNGKMYPKNFKKSKIDLNEFLMQCRSDGYFDVSQIHTAVIEPNGKISIMPFAEYRPATPKDVDISPAGEDIFINLIIDGKILEKNLIDLSWDKKRLLEELRKQGVKDATEVFLAVADKSGTLKIFEKNSATKKNNYFE